MKNLILLSVFLLAAACAKEESDSTTAPPPTVPVPKPAAPSKSGSNTATRPTPVVPITPVTPVAPVTPVVSIKPTLSAKMQSNVVWSCNNSVTGSTLQVNGYANELGEKYLLRIGKAAPVELTDYNDSNLRFCLNTSVGGDNSHYVLTGKWDGAPKDIFYAVLTRYRNLKTKGNCNVSEHMSGEYDVKESFTCTLGEKRMINPDGDNAVAVKELFTFPERFSGNVELKGIRRTLKGDSYIYVGASRDSNIAPRILHFDAKLNLDTRFGKDGELTLELPAEAGGDPIYKIYELVPDQLGGFIVLAELHSSKQVIAAHFDGKGNLKKDILPNGYQLIDKNSDNIFQGAMAVIGKSIVAAVASKVVLINGGLVNDLSGSFAKLRKVTFVSGTAEGEILVSFLTEDHNHWVTRLNSNGKVLSSFEPTPNEALRSDLNLGVTIPLANGDFYYLDADSGRYSGVRIFKFSKSNVVQTSYAYIYSNKEEDISMFSATEARNYILFANGSLAFPLRWLAKKRSWSRQAGAVLIDPTGKATPGYPYHGYKSTLSTSMEHSFSGDAGAVLWAGDNGAIYAVGLYTKTNWHSPPKLILTKVSP